MRLLFRALFRLFGGIFCNGFFGSGHFGLLVALGHGDGCNRALFELHKAHAARIAAYARDIGAVHTDDYASIGDYHYVVFFGDLLHIDEAARGFGEHARLDALACPALQAVIFYRSALAVAVGSYR